jgi:hypothetical protein
MLIHVKQAFEVRSKDGEIFRARNMDIVIPPDWVVHHPFFKALCDSGKVTAHIDSKSVELEQAKDEAKKAEPQKSEGKGKK